jgi:hypothetical protein
MKRKLPLCVLFEQEEKQCLMLFAYRQHRASGIPLHLFFFFPS